MYSNIPLVDSTEDNNQEQKMAQTKVPSLDKSGSASKTVTENTEKLDSKKRSIPSLDKSGFASKTETEQTEKQDSKKRSVQLSSSNDKIFSEQDPKDMRIKIPKTTHDDKSYSSMSLSLDLGPIPRKKNNKVSETSITGNKLTQDPDDTNKEAKVCSSIEGEKQTSVCVTPHP